MPFTNILRILFILVSFQLHGMFLHRLAAQQFQRVGQYGHYHFQGFGYPLGTARKGEDEGFAPYASHGAAEHGMRPQEGWRSQQIKAGMAVGIAASEVPNG